jgi:hypothetical protein
MYMHPDIGQSIARQRQRDAIAAAERHRLVAFARRARSKKSNVAERTRDSNAVRDLTLPAAAATAGSRPGR